MVNIQHTLLQGWLSRRARAVHGVRSHTLFFGEHRAISSACATACPAAAPRGLAGGARFGLHLRRVDAAQPS